MVNKTTFITAHEAALRGLPAGVRGDQVLVHCLEPRSDKEGRSHCDAHKEVAASVHSAHANKDRGDMGGAKCKSCDHLSPLLLCGRLGQISLPALNRLEIVDQWLDGLHAGVFAVLVCELSRQSFCNTGLGGNQLPPAGAGLFQLALEIFND